MVRVFKIDRILGTKLSKINRLERAIEYKTNKKSTIFEWKFGNRILSNVWKCYQVRLVLAAFAFVCNKLAIFAFIDKLVMRVVSCNIGKYFPRFPYFAISLA